MPHNRDNLPHMTKSIRLTTNISPDHGPTLEYLSEKLGMSKSAIVGQILDESLPELYYMVKNAEEKKQTSDDLTPREMALVKALKTVTKYLEGGGK